MGGGLTERSCDRFDYTLQILNHLVVPESEHTPASFEKLPVESVVRPVSVMATVEFDDQLHCDTGEIGDIAPDWILAAKVMTEVMRAKVSP